MNAELLALADIQRDADMMARSSLDPEAVARYHEAYEAREALPPIQVVRGSDGTWLTDGWHRCAAAESLGIRELAADVIMGDKADAYLLAAGHNATHGRPRSKADIGAAIVVALRGLAAKGAPWSNRRLAELVKVSDMTIGRHLPMITEMHPALCNTVEQQRNARSVAKSAERAETTDKVWVTMGPRADFSTDKVLVTMGPRTVTPVPEPWRQSSETITRHVMRYNGPLPDETTSDDVAQQAHRMAGQIVSEAFKTKSLGQSRTEAEHRATIRVIRVGQAKTAVKDLLVVPAAEMAEDWLLDGRTADLAALLDMMVSDLSRYAAEVRQAKPKPLRAVK